MGSRETRVGPAWDPRRTRVGPACLRVEFLVLQLKSQGRVGPAWDPKGPAWDARGTRVGPAGLRVPYYAYVLPGRTIGFPSGIIR